MSKAKPKTKAISTIKDDAATELYRRYRPTELDQLIGQDDVVDMVDPMIENNQIPHSILATGPSGTGKTTIFRILRDVLGCGSMDYKEINAATDRGIDMIREILGSYKQYGISGTTRIWLIDECQALTSQAQESLLKPLEDTPPHVYFFLASTDPQKLKQTIITRCTQLRFRALTVNELQEIVKGVYKKEKQVDLPDGISKTLAELSEGSARQALVFLHQIINMDFTDEEKVLNSLKSVQLKRESIEICRALFNPRTDWSAMAAILRDINEDAEKIRRMVLGYMRNTALKGGKGSKRAVEVITEFEGAFYDGGAASLVRACYSLVGE